VIVVMDPELQKDLNELSKSLHTANLSTKNRLLSVIKDSKFVTSIRERYYPDLPLIPNERCGRWYVPPEYFEGQYTPSYFKSTDGHTNNWSFSTRRLNLHLLPIIYENGGILIVDSTRRGKKIPDSMSKTVSIWIAIINKLIDPNLPFKDSFITPLETVSRYEHERILDLLPDFHANVTRYSDLIVTRIRELGDDIKPLRPFWIYPGCKKLPIFTGEESFHPLIMISSSEQTQDGENKMHGYTYVQGAGDDHELWSRKLTPKVFWDNIKRFEKMIEISSDEVDLLVDTVVVEERITQTVLDEKNYQNVFWRESDIVKVNDLLYFGKIEKNLTFSCESEDARFDRIVVLEPSFKYIKPVTLEQSKVFTFDLESGSKKSSKLLRSELPKIMKELDTEARKLILCNNGEDLSVAVTLCCMNSPDLVDGKTLSKETLRRDLIRLLELRKVNPQRATLNAVNSYLLS
jgi:tRNA A64-2'-O-ribosylphosphate transferase